MKTNRFLKINKLLVVIIITILLLIIIWNLYIKKDNFILASEFLPDDINKSIQRIICNEKKPPGTINSVSNTNSTSDNTHLITNPEPTTNECNDSIKQLFSNN
jgi:hypothetical protein